MSAVAWWVVNGTLVVSAAIFIVALGYALAPTKRGRSDRARQAGLRAVDRELSRDV